MFIKQLYTNCLSESAYYIESEGEAAVIDPLRDIEEYLLLARERNTTIRYIFETHFHADFVSGHLDLAKVTGAPIVFGPDTVTHFPVHVARDGEQFSIGKLTVTVLHTPGHTIESACYLLKNEQGIDHAVFTGDTLFVGDVGRPDLSSGDMSKEALASMMYDSIHDKILPLADDIIVYPAHGPGSSCGKNLGEDTFSTIGEQKQTNYALKARSREDFIDSVIEGLEEAPEYFQNNARINMSGYDSLDEVLNKSLTEIDIAIFKQLLEDEVIALDTRNATVFSQGFVPGSVSIGLEGRFAEWAGKLLPSHQPIILITEKGRERETIIRLARVGFSNIQGYLKGGFEAWQNKGETIDIIIDVEPDELAIDIPYDPNLVVMDVRKEAEYAEGHVKGALNLPLAELKDPGNMAKISEQDNLYVHCGGGYRSVIAISLLKRQGINNPRNVLGGWSKIKEESRIETEKDAAVLN